MLFENLTSPEVKEAVEKGLVEVLPIGSIEVHGPHMPTETDSFVVFRVAEMAEKEEAVVLPLRCYTYVAENRHFPGKIWHDGNNALLKVFLKECVAKKKGYVMYVMIEPWAPLGELATELSEGRSYGHACDIDASIGLYLFGDLVTMDRRNT